MNEKKIFEKYFESSFYDDLNIKTKKIDNLLKDDMLLIAGDFYGIQKFIFENLSTKNASKVLRAKSAFIQIFTQYLAEYICYKLNINKDCIISMTAGKFEILSKNKDLEVINHIQKKVDEYFIKNFYGLSGVGICSVDCTKNDFDKPSKYKELRDKISDEIENKKYNKFDLLNVDNPVLDYDTTITNQTLCKICNIRKIYTNNCKVCDSFINLGQILADTSKEILKNSENLGIDSSFFDDFSCYIALDKRIKSYVLKDGSKIADFETISKNSCKDMDTGVQTLAVLKADIDSMGNYLKNSDVTDCFENFDVYSKSVNNFFSLHIPNLMEKEYKNTYTIFAGGDDFFIVGAWDEVLNLSRRMHDEFKKFIKGKLTISFGIAIVKPSYPVSRFAILSEELLEKSKAIDEKDAITLFGETVKWEKYLNVFKSLDEKFKSIEQNDIKTAFLYRLLEIVEMAINVKYNGSIKDTIWKSKLSYSFIRNMDKIYLSLLSTLDEQIEKYPKETKLFLCEFIYKRRQR